MGEILVIYLRQNAQDGRLIEMGNERYGLSGKRYTTTSEIDGNPINRYIDNGNPQRELWKILHNTHRSIGP